MGSFIEDAARDMKMRNANLKALAKTFATDKAKVQIAKDTDDMDGQLGLLLARKIKLDARIAAASGLTTEIAQFNSTLKALKYKAAGLVKACGQLRGAGDTPKRDFNGILGDMQFVIKTPELEIPK